MTPDAIAALATVREARRRARPVLWLFDYDGTLTPVVAHPSLATLAPAVRATLERLARGPGEAVGVVSGRRLSELRALVGLPDIYYAGTGGMELDLRGRTVRHPDEARIGALLERVAAALDSLMPDWPGAWIERKALGLTVHWRDLEAARHADFRRVVTDRLRPWHDELQTFAGPMATEILAREGWDKGTAVEHIAAELAAGHPLVIYAGDQDNDRHAFEAVAVRGGMSIGIGANAPAGATVTLPDPAALHDLMAEAAG
jgi:trehalose 6-phosphate phosphatase